MVEIYDAEYCFMYNGLLCMDLFLDSSASYFFQCDASEAIMVFELSEALSKLGQGSQFAFYDLTIKQDDQLLLSSLVFTQFHNKVLYLSDTNSWFDDFNEVFDIQESNTYRLMKLTSSIVSNVVSVVKAKDAEIILRTRGSYEEGACCYWHIDKSRNHPNDTLNYADLVFLVPLHGESTVYQEANVEWENLFHSLANETTFYYGHTECHDNDEITKLFEIKDIQSPQYGHGSVHVVGKYGTLHREPKKSDFGRLILLITPIY